MNPASRPPKISVEPLPENLFREPIDYLLADHFRLRVICDCLAEVASIGVGSDAAQSGCVILGYLETDFPLHVADEEEDLLPLLRERGWVQPAGSDRLIDEHCRDNELRLRLLLELRRIAAGQPAERPTEFAHAAEVFIDSVRRHLAWEDTTILQEARRHLAASDLDAIGRRMADRRGIPFPES